ncbi:chemotaxis protein CheB [Mucilaginibacter sp.]|uniref:chemotaxis protein CheB n=1 Tax=Mucilaginibacter sp. TaxID=1882438 RepID=UPI0026035902|nr:chemotaxis protein CheB [Mucilaginibacter sp.]MDB4918646.1 two-component system, chemotaxis family, response regulator CheB [Mucilaginibacter sp.]
MGLDKNIIDRWHNSDIVLLGGSAGSFKLLFGIVKFLPPDLNKAVIIVMHRKRNFTSEMERLFAQNSRMLLREIGDKDKINKGTIYVAPANYHVLIESDGHFSLDVSDAVWYSKPSIDITFESAAEIYKNKCTAILLSGANQDGAQGLLKLRNAGSLTIAQHPDDAEMPEMPNEAININAVDYVLRTNEIFELLID